jgi:hypothetical protein
MCYFSAPLRFALFFVLALSALAQIGEPTKVAIADVPGPPKSPPFYSQISLILLGDHEMQPPLPAPKGPVEEVQWEQSRVVPSEPEKGLVLVRSIDVKYDAQQHEIERIDAEGNSPYKSWSKTTSVYRDSRLQSQETQRFGGGRPPGPVQWRRLSYDGAGRISELRSGTGSSLENHYLNYRYDSIGRLLGFAYRQGEKDEAFSHTKIEYNGVLVRTETIHDQFGSSGALAQVLDNTGRVVDVRYSEEGPEPDKPRLFHAAFKYDEQGREVEQITDPYTPQSGDDSEPVPGKVAVRYDDNKHSREVEYTAPDGKQALHVISQLDRNGAVCSLRSFDADGNEYQTSDSLPDPKTHTLKKRDGRSEWAIVYDEQGNWTERRRWFTPADGSSRVMTQMVRQMVRYR